MQVQKNDVRAGRVMQEENGFDWLDFEFSFTSSLYMLVPIFCHEALVPQPVPAQVHFRWLSVSHRFQTIIPALDPVSVVPRSLGCR